MIVIFPTFIAPWFNKFEPLKEGEFRDRILALADQVGFKTSGIYSDGRFETLGAFERLFHRYW